MMVAPSRTPPSDGATSRTTPSSYGPRVPTMVQGWGDEGEGQNEQMLGAARRDHA